MDAWDTYLKRQQQPAPRPGSSLFGLLSAGTGGTGGIRPDKRGMYTPSLMGQMGQPGPATPINYQAIRNLLSSGVLRGGSGAPVAPTPAQPAPELTPLPQGETPQNPLARLFSVFGGMRR